MRKKTAAQPTTVATVEPTINVMARRMEECAERLEKISKATFNILGPTPAGSALKGVADDLRRGAKYGRSKA